MMDLRSSRSRSRTPFIQTQIDQEIVSEQKNHTIEETTVVHHSYSTRNRINRNNSSSLSDEVFASPGKQKSEKTITRSRHKTSDYSSEEGENEISSSKLDGHDAIASNSNSKKIKSTNGDVKSPLQVYKEAGEYWNKYPKTDYTYSIHSRDRIELAPGRVAMPNMSRRSLRRSMDQTTASSTLNNRQQSSYYSSSVDHSQFNHKTKFEPKALFRDEADYEYETKITNSSMTRRVYRSMTSVLTRFFTSVVTVLTMAYSSVVSSVLWVGRGYYKTVSRLLLLDTWILQSSSGIRRLGPLIALIFLPLLLLTGWWLWSGLSHALQGAFISSTTEPFQEASAAGLVDNTPLDEEISKFILASTDDSKNTYNVGEIVRAVLENPEFEKIIAKHISSRTAMFADQQRSVDALQSDVWNVNKKVEDLTMNIQLENARNNARFSMELNKCCKRQFIHIESYVKKILADIIGVPNANIHPHDISSWLHTIFVAKQDLEARLSNLTQYLHSDLDNLVEISAAKIMNDVSDRINLKLKERLEINSNSIGVDSALSDSQVQRIVKEALAVYDADKTGLVDYALESSGGQILSTRCTESYHTRTAVVSMLGIPLWYPSNTPRIVITPGVTPGECWAFQNFPGFLVIQLSAYVRVSAFSLEHIPKSLAPRGQRDSAPKAFTVWGLTSENDREPWQLGNYAYDLNGPSLQFFTVQNKGSAFNMVELRIESNHGNENYTCLYRFRVHGIFSDEPT